MALVYKFKKEELEDGGVVLRPRVLVTLKGENMAVNIPALIDTGCDVTVLSKRMAEWIGINMSGEKTVLYGYKEQTPVVESRATITFVAKASRESVTVHVPVLISMNTEGLEDESEIILGLDGIFDVFNVHFKRANNRIILERVRGTI